MEDFDYLVEKQLHTMDKLLFIQSEIERYQQELIQKQNETNLEFVQIEILQKKQELKKIQTEFEIQTEEVISFFQNRLHSAP